MHTYIEKVTHKTLIILVITCLHKNYRHFFKEIIIEFSQEFGYLTNVSRTVKISHLTQEWTVCF